MNCSNCNAEMSLILMKDLVDSSAYPNRKRLIGLMDSRMTNKVYMCKTCGKLEFPEIAANINEQKKRKGALVKFEKISASEAILLETETLAAPAEINTLLKIIPRKINLQQVITKLHNPIKKQVLESGILLDFKSFTPDRPHKILIDPVYQDVKFLAIYNDHHAFDLQNLSDAYGDFKYVIQIEDFRFWFFENAGVAFATYTNSDQDVGYVQFFESRLTIEQYVENQCFFEETFTP